MNASGNCAVYVSSRKTVAISSIVAADGAVDVNEALRERGDDVDTIGRVSPDEQDAVLADRRADRGRLVVTHASSVIVGCRRFAGGSVVCSR